MEISVLGPLRARTADGTDVDLGGRRQQAVLARLVLAAGRVVPTDQLVDELWDGDAPPAAKNTLQSYVSHLRRALGGEHPVIERQGDGYRARVEDVDLPSVRTEELLARVATGADPADERLALVDAALAAWHGPPLGALAEEPWAQGDAARLAELQLAAAEARAALLLDLGRHAVAAVDLEVLAREHPLRERFTALLVLALYRSGRQADALRAHERLRTHLADELGLDPSPELARLHQQVLAHDPGLDLAPPRPGTGPSPTAAGTRTGFGRTPLPPAVTERRSRTAFVGRDAARAAVHAARERVAEGSAELVVLAGEPGAGKSRLARQLATEAHDAGVTVLWGRCTAEAIAAHQPVVEALRTAVRARPDAEREALFAGRAALAALLPDLAPDPPGDRLDRGDLHVGMADLFAEASVEAPLLLVVDDAQWADPATVALLDHLVRLDGRAHLLVVATVRRPPGRPTPELDRLVADVRREGRLTEVAVEGLDAGELVDLLDRQGVHVSPAEADALRVRTGGNPFFLEALVEHGGIGDAEAVPATVLDLLDERLQALGEADLQVLSAAAVVGARVDLAVLGATVDLGPDALLDVVDAAVASHLLVEDEELGWVGFPHALVRSALVRRLTRNREARLHVRIADAVAARPSVLDREATVAHHLLAAGQLVPAPRAAAAAVDAGRRALTAAGEEDALAWSERALAALDAAPAGDEEWRTARLATQLLRAEAGRLVGAEAATATALDELIETAIASDDPDLRLRVAAEAIFVRTGFIYPWGLQPADDRLEVLVAGVDDLPAAVRPVMLALGSQSLSSTVEHAVSVARAEAAVAHLGILDGNARAMVVLTHRQAISGPAGLDARLAQHPFLLDPVRVDDYSLRLGALVFAVAHLWEAGRIAEARAAHDELCAYMAPHPRPWYDAYLAFVDGMVDYLEGDHDRGRAQFERGILIGEPGHAGPRSQFGLGLRVMDARARGEEAVLAPLVADVRDRRPDLAVGPALAARVALATGDDGTARHLADAAVLPGPDDVLWYLTVDLWAEVARLLDHGPLGRTVADAVAPYAGRIGVVGQCSLTTGPLHVPHGRALAAAGDVDGARAALRAAVTLGEEHGLRPTVATATAELEALD